MRRARAQVALRRAADRAPALSHGRRRPHEDAARRTGDGPVRRISRAGDAEPRCRVAGGICRHFRADQTGYRAGRSEENTYELQSLMRLTYAVFSLHKNILVIISITSISKNIELHSM